MIFAADTACRWRSEPGSYLLLLDLAVPAPVEVGRLGRFELLPGRYIYFGSALGPGGVAGRLNRHLRPGKRTHWHVDYLASTAPVVAVGAVYGAERRECAWAQVMQSLPSASAPVPGFGSSDCRSGCVAHLWLLPDALPLSCIEDRLTRCPIQTI